MKKQIGAFAAILVLSCSDNGTTVQDESLSSNSEAVLQESSSNGSSSLLLSLAHLSSGQELSSSMILGSSGTISSSSAKVASSSAFRSSAVTLSSSVVAVSSSMQALQFLDNQVRLPDGCGVIHWSNRDEFTCVQDFWVDTTEVTIGKYQTLMGRGVSSQYHNGIYIWKGSDGVTVVDDGSPCPLCPVDAATLYEAMLYANAMTKSVLHSNDTVYSYTGIDSTAGTGIYLRIKGQEIIGLQNLKIDSTKSGFRLPTRGEFHYMCMKENLISMPWDDQYSDDMAAWRDSDLFVWGNPNSGGVTHPVATKKGTTWHLYDLIGNADDWTTTPNAESPGNYLALGGSVDINGDIHNDLRRDELRAGFRLVRGKSVQKIVPVGN